MYLLTKLSMGMLTIPVLIASGFAKVPWLRLLAVSIVVEPIWNGLLVLAGYRLGDSVAHMERGTADRRHRRQRDRLLCAAAVVPAHVCAVVSGRQDRAAGGGLK